MRPVENEADEHPLVGRIALMAIALAVVGIVWAKVEILGMRDIERTLAEESVTLAQKCVERMEAVAFNRWVAR